MVLLLDVDEDVRNIIPQGGRWFDGNAVGIMIRYMFDLAVTDYAADDVASRCRHPKLIKYYTDWHDVDEETRTILAYGGYWDTWGKSEAAGMMCRHMYDIHTNTYDVVASVCQHLKLSKLYGYA